MRNFFVGALFLVCPLAFADSGLECRFNAGKNWQPYNLTKKVFIGPAGDGYTKQSDCQSAVKGRGRYSVCTWNGSNFQPYSIESGQGIGLDGYGLTTIALCVSATQNDVGGITCNWTGSGFSPYFSGSGRAVGTGNGYNEMGACVDVISAAVNATVCNWDGQNEVVYSKATNRPVKKFGTITKECTDFTRTVSDQNPSPYKWKTDPNDPSKAIGCTMLDTSYARARVVDEPLSVCESGLKVNYVLNADNTECTETAAGNLVIGHPDVETCLSKMPNAKMFRAAGTNGCVYVIDGGAKVLQATNAAACEKTVDEFDAATKTIKLGGPVKWTGSKGNQCAEFIKDPQSNKLTYAHDVDQSNCLIPSLTYFQWLDSSSSVCVGYTACGVSAGTVDSKFCAGKTNRFAQNWPSKGYTWSQCHISNTGTSIPFDKKGTFTPECAPDTLYGWHSWSRISAASEEHNTKEVIRFGHDRFFLWRTPIGSFGYGNASFRFKLRPAVKFVWVDFDNRDCGALAKHNDIQNSVFVDHNSGVGNGNYSEYVLCSAGPIESWSTDLSYDVDEMDKEYSWIHAHSRGNKEFDSLSGTNLGNSFPWSVDQDWDSEFGHDNDWSEAALKKNIAQSRKNVNLGRVFFSRDAIPSLWNHFSTAHPGYFNAYDAAGAAGADTWPERDADACTDP